MSTVVRIPYIFTSDGWKNYFKSAILEESRNPGKEDWVMGKSQTTQSYQSEFDSEKMKSQLTDLYIKDFMQTWIQFIGSISYSGFESVPLAANTLKILSDPVNSPLVSILKAFADHTKALSEVQSSSDTTKIIQPGFSSSNNIDIKRFRKFIVGPDDGSSPPDLNMIIMQYGLINGSLEGIKGGQDLIKEYAVKVMNQQAVEFQTSIKTIQSALYNVPELQNLINRCQLRLGWRSILSDASSYINNQWKTKVVDVYKKMLARFISILVKKEATYLCRILMNFLIHKQVCSGHFLTLS